MANVITFIPNSALGAKRNLHDFINHCRNLNPFDVDISFESTVWALGKSLNSRGRRSNLHLSFVKNGSRRLNKIMVPLEGDYARFAKSYILYQQSMAPTKFTALNCKLVALQVIEVALLDGGKMCPTDINGAVLDRAAAVLTSQGWGTGRNYTIGREIERLAVFLRANRLTRVVFNWTNFLSVPDDAQIKIGADFERKRDQKLPDEYHLELLANAFQRAKHKADIVATAAIALLLSQPSRISEVLTLPLDCMVPRSDKKPGIFLRWWPAKNGNPMLKPVALPIMDAAREAICRLERIGAPARRVAKHYEEHPNLLYLNTECRHLRLNKYLTFNEVGAILWGDAFNLCQDNDRLATEKQKIINVTTWLGRKNIPFERGQRFCKDSGKSALNIRRVLFRDLQDVIIGTLPPGFPVLDMHTGLRYSEALFASLPNELSFTKKSIICSVVPVEYQNVTTLICENSGRSSMYLRTGVKNSEHDLISIKSHQPRHFLNTLANAANMDGFDIAAWSGRKFPQQNSVYDHVSSAERAEEMRPTVLSAVSAAAPAHRLGKYIPIRRENFSVGDIKAAHLTDLGHCVHDFTMSPCLHFADHINCNEHEVIKGESQTNENIKQALSESQKLVAIAQRAWRRGNNPAKIWLEHHQSRIDHLREIIAILDDPNVEAGTAIRLSNGKITSRVVPTNLSNLTIT